MFKLFLKVLSIWGLCTIMTACGGGTSAKPKPSASSSQVKSARPSSSSKPSQSKTKSSSSRSSSSTSASSSSTASNSTTARSSAMSKSKEKPVASSTTTASSSSDSSSKPTEASSKTEASQAELVALPQNFVGVWEYHGPGHNTTITIDAAGGVTNELVYKEETAYGQVTQEQLSQYIKVTDNIYRLPESAGGITLIPATGMGGTGKSVIGLYLAPDGTLYPQSWGMPADADSETYDYANNIMTLWPMTRVE